MMFKKQEMVDKIITLANLPKSKKTDGYLSKGQITALYLFLQKSKEEFARLKERVAGCQE